MNCRPLLALLLLPTVAAFAQQGGQTPTDNDSPGREIDGPDRFWQADLDGGHYMVALDRITSVSMHEYLLGGNLVVREMTVDTSGKAIARFYHIAPLTDEMKRNGITNLAQRGAELLDRAGQRLGTRAHEMVQKDYPNTTHAGTIEYRIPDLRELDAIYNSLRRAWISGEGRRLTFLDEDPEE